MAEKIIQQSDDSFFLVEHKVKGDNRNQRLIFFVDGDNGITIDDCAKISRALGDEIESNEWISNPYTIEVSTPGVDQPLKLKRQYHKNIGRNLSLTLKDGANRKGKLVSVGETDITLEVKLKKKETETIQIALDDISKAIVNISFS